LKRELSEYEAFVFDFDGVLADSVELKTEAFARLFEEYGPEIQQRVVEHHRKHGGMTRAEKIRHYYRVFLGKPIEDGSLSALCNRFSILVVDNVVAAPEIQGAKGFLDFWYGRLPLFIDSATPDVEIAEIVSRRGLSKYFGEILGSGRPKAENLVYILEKHKIEPKNCLFFGDAASDYDAAMKCAVDFVGMVPESDAPLLRHAPHIKWFHDFSEIPLPADNHNT